jgi:hypothetical protein
MLGQEAVQHLGALSTPKSQEHVTLSVAREFVVSNPFR